MVSNPASQTNLDRSDYAHGRDELKRSVLRPRIGQCLSGWLGRSLPFVLVNSTPALAEGEPVNVIRVDTETAHEAQVALDRMLELRSSIPLAAK